MTTDQLQAYRDAAAKAKSRADKATPGPWCIWEGLHYVGGGADLCIGAGGDKWLANMDHRETRCPQIFENGHNADECNICSIDANGVTDEQRANAVLLSSSRTDIPTLADAVVELAAEVERLQADNAKLHNRIKEQTAATQEAHEFVDNEIRNHLEGIVELGDKSCPIWQRVRSAVERLTEACAKGAAIIHNIADGSEYARGREDERKSLWTYARACGMTYFSAAIERGEHVAKEATNGKDL